MDVKGQADRKQKFLLVGENKQLQPDATVTVIPDPATYCTCHTPHGLMRALTCINPAAGILHEIMIMHDHHNNAEMQRCAIYKLTVRATPA
jgi:hypothetical protein